MIKGKGGPPKGTVNNPKGINQFSSGKLKKEKDARLEIVLPLADKILLKEIAQKKGVSLSSWILEVMREAASA